MDYEFLEKLFMSYIGLIICLFVFGIGVAIGGSRNVNEVEPDYIVYNDKVYCEVSNIEKGE